jgi:hypothetical protein
MLPSGSVSGSEGSGGVATQVSCPLWMTTIVTVSRADLPWHLASRSTRLSRSIHVVPPSLVVPVTTLLLHPDWHERHSWRAWVQPGVSEGQCLDWNRAPRHRDHLLTILFKEVPHVVVQIRPPHFEPHPFPPYALSSHASGQLRIKARQSSRLCRHSGQASGVGGGTAGRASPPRRLSGQRGYRASAAVRTDVVPVV